MAWSLPRIDGEVAIYGERRKYTHALAIATRVAFPQPRRGWGLESSAGSAGWKTRMGKEGNQNEIATRGYEERANEKERKRRPTDAKCVSIRCGGRGWGRWRRLAARAGSRQKRPRSKATDTPSGWSGSRSARVRK